MIMLLLVKEKAIILWFQVVYFSSIIIMYGSKIGKNLCPNDVVKRTKRIDSSDILYDHQYLTRNKRILSDTTYNDISSRAFLEKDK